MREIFLYSLVSLVVSCTTFDALMQDPAREVADWQPLRFDGEHFQIIGWQKPGEMPNKDIRVYIEGDGFAWASASQPSSDPTPRNAVAMQLARMDETENIIYLARPCQYSARLAAGCDENRWWTSARYSREVVDRYHAILTQIKAGQGSGRFELVGYSGGAAIAAILAAERSDIVSLRTVAGNLDSEYVNQIHHVSAMPESLNPVQFASALHIPQLHFRGLHDQVVPQAVVQRFMGVQLTSCARMVEIGQADHYHGWQALWPQLLEKPLPACP